jgi:hypothetical protein
MSKPFLCWTERGETVGLWLKSILQACGLSEPAIPDTEVAAWHEAPETFYRLFRANCFFGVLAPVKSADSPYPSRAPSKKFISVLQWALRAHFPCALLVDKDIQISNDVKSASVRVWQVDFSDPAALLEIAPSIVRFAIQQQWGHRFGEPITFTYDPGKSLERLSSDDTTL